MLKGLLTAGLSKSFRLWILSAQGFTAPGIPELILRTVISTSGKVGKHPGELKVVSASAEIRSVLKKNVQPLVLTPERRERLRVNDPSFYYSLVFGPIVLYGEHVSVR